MNNSLGDLFKDFAESKIGSKCSACDSNMIRKAVYSQYFSTYQCSKCSARYRWNSRSKTLLIKIRGLDISLTKELIKFNFNQEDGIENTYHTSVFDQFKYDQEMFFDLSLNEAYDTFIAMHEGAILLK